MFSSTRFVSSSFLNKFQLHDTLRQIQGVSASGFRRPTKSQRRSLKLFAFRNSRNSNSSPSLLTPKHLPGLLNNNNSNNNKNPRQTFFDFQPESFDGMDSSSDNNNNSIRRSQENKFAKIQVPKPEQEEKNYKNENANSSSSIQRRIRQVLENPEDDPKTYPADSWERERAEIRRRAKISLIKKDRFMTTYKDRAMNDASKHGVDFNEHLFQNDGVRKNSAMSKEQRFIRQLKKYELDGFSNVDVENVGSGAADAADINNNTNKNHDDDLDDERIHSNSVDYNTNLPEKKQAKVMRFLDLDQKMRQEQLDKSNESEESSYDEGEAAFSESHLTPEEIAIKIYNQQHHHNIVQESNDHDDADEGFYNQTPQTGQQLQQQQQQDFNSNNLDDDSAAYLAVKDHDEREFDENTQDSSSSYPEYRYDGRPYEKHEKLWELHEQLQKGKINQQDDENPFLTGEARSRPALDSTSASIHRYETSNLSQGDIESNQKRFNDLLESAIVLFSPPHKDALSTADLAMALKRADKNFSPHKYGSPELIFLLRNSCFLMNWKGKWAFLRLFDQEREDVTVKLEKYKFRESPSSDGVRSVPTREIDAKKWN